MIVYQIAFSYQMPLPGVVEIVAENEEEARKIFADVSKDMSNVSIVDFKAIDTAEIEDAELISTPISKLN